MIQLKLEGMLTYNLWTEVKKNMGKADSIAVDREHPYKRLGLQNRHYLAPHWLRPAPQNWATNTHRSTYVVQKHDKP